MKLTTLIILTNINYLHKGYKLAIFAVFIGLLPTESFYLNDLSSNHEAIPKLEDTVLICCKLKSK